MDADHRVKLEFIGLFTILSKIEIPDQSNLFWLHCIQQAISFLLEMLHNGFAVTALSCEHFVAPAALLHLFCNHVEERGELAEE